MSSRLCSMVCVLMMAWSWVGCGDDDKNAQQPSNNLPNNQTNNATNNQTQNNPTNNQTENNANQFQDCPVEARPVYVVDATVAGNRADFKLLRFEPERATFTAIGQLNCPSQRDATPFSMSVDRRGRAWVLYSSGEIFLVDTTTAACERSGFKPRQPGFDVFGMGFVLQKAGATTDVLYVAGGDQGGISEGTATLGQMNGISLELSPIAKLGGWPELTGTARGELWGFFPGTTPPKVAKLSRADGSESSVFPVDSITGDPNAWAFAFWGGHFYLFYKSQDDESSRVFRLTPADGKVEEIITDTGLYIVGAGVSTCAPTTL